MKKLAIIIAILLLLVNCNEEGADNSGADPTPNQPRKSDGTKEPMPHPDEKPSNYKTGEQ